MKMEPIVSSETSAIRTQTPGNYPKRNNLHLEHGESLRTKFRDLLHAANLRHGTDSFTSPPKEGVLRIFFRPKNPTASAGFEPANLGTKGQHATPKPPKPILLSDNCEIVHSIRSVD